MRLPGRTDNPPASVRGVCSWYDAWELAGAAGAPEAAAAAAVGGGGSGGVALGAQIMGSDTHIMALAAKYLIDVRTDLHFMTLRYVYGTRLCVRRKVSVRTWFVHGVVKCSSPVYGTLRWWLGAGATQHAVRGVWVAARGGQVRRYHRGRWRLSGVSAVHTAGGMDFRMGGGRRGIGKPACSLCLWCSVVHVFIPGRLFYQPSKRAQSSARACLMVG